MTIVSDSKKFAKKKHQHQFRDDKKTPYWKHLEIVVNNLKALGINDQRTYCAGWLHDTIEDTDTDFDDVEKEFDKKTAEIVATVTKDTRMRKKEREIAYCKQLKKGSWQAQIVKFADILANLEDLKNAKRPNNWKRDQARNKLEYYNSIKHGLQKNKKNIPNLDSQTTRLFEIFLQYGIKN